MILIPQSDEKQIAPQDATNVFYATAPGHVPTNGSEDPNELARQFDANLNIEDAPPPSYDDVTNTEVPDFDASEAPRVAQNDVKDRSLFEKAPTGYSNDGPVPRSNSSFAQSGSFASNARSLENQGSSSRFPQGPAFQPPRQVPRGPVFQALVMHSKSKKLEDGFFLTPPPTDIQPHPFSQRDVTEASWTKFLTALQTSTRLSPPSSQSSPSPCGDRNNIFKTIGSLARTVSTSGYPSGKQPEQDTRGGPGALIDEWNENFFHRRGLDVTLAKGSRRLNGDRSLPPPDASPEEWDASARSSPSILAVSSGSMSRAQPAPSMPAMPKMPSMYPASSMPPPIPGGLLRGDQEKYRRSPRSHSRASSVSSCSSPSDSDSDPEDTRQRTRARGLQPQPVGPSCPIAAHGSNSRSDRRAMKKERRMARKYCRAERRALKVERRMEREQNKFERKLSKFESKLASRGPGGGGRCRSVQGDMMQGRGMSPSGSGFQPKGPLGLVYSLATAALAANSKGSEDEGYYRLIVADISMY